MKFRSPAEARILPADYCEPVGIPVELLEQIRQLRIRVASVLSTAEQISKKFAA